MKRVGIEALLSWAYRDELPKDGAAMRLRDRPAGHGRPWDDVGRWGEHLALIDGGENRWGLAPDLGALAEPDPLAVRVGRAVEALGALAVVVPEGWDPLADLGDLGALGRAAVAAALERATHVDEAGARRIKGLAGIVKRHALREDAPVWQAEVPRVQVECAHGKPLWFRTIHVAGEDGTLRPIEIDGYDPRAKRPLPGAYRKSYLDPCPIEAAIGRAEYEAWHAALGVLVADLGPVVRDEAGVPRVEILPCARPARPWQGEPAEAGRVLEVDGVPVVSWPLGLWGGAGLKQMRGLA